jgi:ribosome-binding factor A
VATQYRQQRISDLLLSFIAEEIRKLRDPRIALITITGIDVSKDYRHARVYWSAVEESGAARFPDEATIAEIDSALRGVSGLLKKRIGSELQLKFTPALHFKYDASAQTGSRIDQLLRDAGL